MSKRNSVHRYKVHAIHQFSEKQKELVNLALHHDTKVVFIEGPSGTSKTFLAVYCALKLLSDQRVDGINYIRSIEESGRKSFGILPGEMEEKFLPHIVPFYEKVQEILEPLEARDVLKKESGITDCIPVNFCRGRNWANKAIIFDEAQNADIGEITTVLTRLANGSIMFICGDTMQSDVRESGFRFFINAFNNPDSVARGIFTFQFEIEDIVRSDILKFIIDQIEQEKERIAEYHHSGLEFGVYSQRRSGRSSEGRETVC